ncbi:MULTISPECIES: hypothetical protein [Prauserella salsuginis group]|uniref:Uncharacterized protein n=2 Tax=Prauserella salsuginis group TaxID=2893672 RepID=A0A839XKC9_9PSEU|nr:MULTISPECIES: hypothetical protein [Prauserella salsuginis group]MBB3663211.1 hypothetical protein [Prauserella sediminis]MCR3720962.1 hypothetical protein [Prauserella flava]MCR3734957.1 hypothetical protein [Prauserella salsuginis]
MAVRLEMPRAGAPTTEPDVPDLTDHAVPALPSPRKPRRFGPGLVSRRPPQQDGAPDDRRLTSRYVARL